MFIFCRNNNSSLIEITKRSSTQKDLNSDKVERNSSNFQTAESRFFPIGKPNHLIPYQESPFDVASFGKQLLPLINFHVKEKVKDFAKTITSSADYIEDALRDSWRESPLNPHNFKYILNPPHVVETNSLRNTVHFREKAPKSHSNSHLYTKDGPLQEYGIDGYKHFEKSILRELEKQEELKVEATIHTLFEQGDKVEIIHGKPYHDHKLSWKPVPAPTKVYENPDEIHSQIISPLHTNIFNTDSLSPNHFDSPDIVSSFHDFDNLNDNSIHFNFEHHKEEELESKIKPVVEQQVKITPIKLRAVVSTPSTTTIAKTTTLNSAAQKPRLSTRYKKRHNNSVLKVIGGHESQRKNVTKSDSISSASSSSSQSHNFTPKASVKPIKLRNYDYQSSNLTTSRPSTFKLTSLKAEESRIFTSTDNSHHRYTTSITSNKKTTTLPTTTTTKAPKASSKFVDKTRSSGYRGSIKFGQTTTKKPN